MNTDKILKYINEKISILEKEYEELGREDLEITDVYRHIKFNLNLTELTNYKKLHDSEYLHDYANCDKAIKKVIDNYTNHKRIIRTSISEKIDNIFKKDNILKLERFNVFRIYIIGEYINIINNELQHIDIWFQKSIDDLKYNLSKIELSNFEQKCEFNFKRYILKNLELFEITDKKLLIENDEWKLKRITLKEEITKYNNCKTIIANL